MSRALIVLNPAAHGGQARQRFARVEPVVEARMAFEVIETDRADIWRNLVAEALAGGVRLFVAAGGDGTVSALVDTLATRRDDVALNEITVGAIGLGSSNDFHKPYRRVVGGVPLRIDPAAAACTRRDVGIVHYVAKGGADTRRHFVVSASVGVVADANASFNRDAGPLEWLKRHWTGGAILWAGIGTIATYRNFDASVQIDSLRESIETTAAITNLSVLKTPYLSGSLRYDTPVEPDSGSFAVNMCAGMSRLRTMQTLGDLGRGRFQGRSGCFNWEATRVELRTDRDVALELDGEVVMASLMSFELLPDRIRQCG